MKIYTFCPRGRFYKPLLFLSACLTAFSMLLSGCRGNTELDNYKVNMNQFFENIKIYDSSINALDPESETAVTDLLALLDSMDQSFRQMASLEVPDGFPGVEELADEASDYMTEAVSYYHQAFEAQPFDTVLADVARQNYDRANLRIQYILSILHGDIPEEIYTYEDEEGADDGEAPAEDDEMSAEDAETSAGDGETSAEN